MKMRPFIDRLLGADMDPVAPAAGTAPRPSSPAPGGALSVDAAHPAPIGSRDAVHAINQRIFETSLDLILVVDRKGNFIRVSPSAVAILGYRADEMVGRSAKDFVYPPDLEHTRQEMRQARRGRQTSNFDCRYVHKDGHAVPLAWTGVWSEPEEQYFFIGRDMTDRLAAEQREQRSQRLEAIGQLTGGIAHDFNNLLTVIIGNLDLLNEGQSVDPKTRQFAQAALKAALRGAELTGQLLAFARRQSLDAVAFDVNERVSATLDLLRRSLGEQVEIATELAPDLPPAFADPAQFESALVNLAINARDAMGGRGRLTIETACRRLDEDLARQNFEAAPGDYVMIAVSDTGTGMAPEILEHAFEPFFTTKGPGEGTGMGLSMVYGFTRQSHGFVKIYSEPGHGTTVRLYLPEAVDATRRDAVREQEPATPPQARDGECVLVVEDNADVRRFVVTLLGDLGYRTLEAEDATAALACLEREEAIDLLFTDVVMPGMSGDELARAAQELRPGVKVLLTSGFSKAALESGQRPEAFRNLLNKPYRKIDLAIRLRETLDGPA